MSFKMQVEGDQILIRKFGNAKSAVDRRLTRGAMTAACRVIAKEMKRLAPKDSGLLKKSIGQVVRTYRNNGITVGVIGPRKGFKTVVMRSKPFGGDGGLSRSYPVLSDPVKYARLVEFGTEPHPLGGESMHPGSPAKPFIRTAFDGKKNEALKVFNDNFQAGMQRELTKAGK